MIPEAVYLYVAKTITEKNKIRKSLTQRKFQTESLLSNCKIKRSNTPNDLKTIDSFLTQWRQIIMMKRVD